MKVELSVLDKGAILSIIESVHARRVDAMRHAAACAKEYAARYDGEVKKLVGDFWIIQYRSGRTFAQFAIR